MFFGYIYHVLCKIKHLLFMADHDQTDCVSYTNPITNCKYCSEFFHIRQFSHLFVNAISPIVDYNRSLKLVKIIYKVDGNQRQSTMLMMCRPCCLYGNY